MGPFAGCGGGRQCAAREASSDRFHRIRVLADRAGDRHPAIVVRPASAQSPRRTAGNAKARQSIDLSSLAAGLRNDNRAVRDLSAGWADIGSRLSVGAASGVRPAGLSGWIWRWLLRSHPGGAAGTIPTWGGLL